MKKKETKVKPTSWRTKIEEPFFFDEKGWLLIIIVDAAAIVFLAALVVVALLNLFKDYLIIDK